MLFILNLVPLVYTGHPDDPGSELIPVIDPEQGWPEVSAVKSAQGRGGMSSKLGTAKKMSGLGITTHIASIDIPSIITRLIAQEQLGTIILPSKKKSNIKKWMAYNNGKQVGSIVINQGLFDILKENKRVISLLPVGIEQSRGEFKKGDLVEILNLQEHKIGIGIAKNDANKLNEYIGQKDKPIFIHYDHLHLF